MTAQNSRTLPVISGPSSDGFSPSTLAAGDVSVCAFQVLYRQQWLAMVRLATLLIGDTTHAQDATQDAFVRVHRRWVTHGPPDHPVAYVRKAVVNQCRVVGRRRMLFARKAPLIAGAGVMADPLDVVGPQRDMAVALGCLPRRMREVVVLRFYQDCDVATTAELLGVSVGTVKSATSKALTKLRRMMTEETS